MEHDSNPMGQCVQVALRAIIGPVLALMLLTVEAVSAEIRVFSGAAPQNALRDLAPEFERATGDRVEFTFRIVSEIQENSQRVKKRT
jgi:ABC-type molybdate transport system substrate-binding protein